MDRLRIRLGRRGSSLLLFGFVWMAIAYGFFVDRLTPAPGGVFALIPSWVIGLGWVACGLYAIGSAFGARHDWGGFAALMVMPLIRAASFLWAWLVYLLTGGEMGSGDGFIQTTLYGLIAALIYLIGGWPEPLRLPESGALNDEDGVK